MSAQDQIEIQALTRKNAMEHADFQNQMVSWEKQIKAEEVRNKLVVRLILICIIINVYAFVFFSSTETA